MRWDAVTLENRCASCGEPDPCPDPVHACGECGHAWKTDADLIAHTFKVHVALDPAAEPLEVADIHTCPCCAHDL